MGASSDLRIYVVVTSPYPWNRGVTVVEGYPSTAIPPAAPLAAEPSVAEPISVEFAPGLGKINPVHIIRLFVCSH